MSVRGDLFPPGRSPGRLLAIAAVALAALPVACSNPFRPEEAELARARARWEAQGLADYRFEYRTFCFCLNLHGLVEVRAGRVVAVTELETGAPAPGESLDRYPTIDELFDTLATWIGREPFFMEVTYDAQLGYPRTASFDFEFNVVDEEQAFRADALTPIAEPPPGMTLPGAIVR